MTAHPSYGLTKELPDLSYADAVPRVRTALKNRGFGVLTEIDIQATLKAKLDVEHRPYIILGACNPSLAHRALTGEPLIGLLLPCNVVVMADEAGSGSIVSAVSPTAMFSVVNNDEVVPIAAEVETLLKQVIAAL